jgi:hypothetical protein
MGSTYPNEQEFKTLSRFPNVFFMKGNAELKSDLFRSNFFQAFQVILLSEAKVKRATNDLTDGDENDDDEIINLKSILTYHLMQHLLEIDSNPANHSIRITTELHQAEALKFLTCVSKRPGQPRLNSQSSRPSSMYNEPGIPANGEYANFFAR